MEVAMHFFVDNSYIINLGKYGEINKINKNNAYIHEAFKDNKRWREAFTFYLRKLLAWY